MPMERGPGFRAAGGGRGRRAASPLCPRVGEERQRRPPLCCAPRRIPRAAAGNAGRRVAGAGAGRRAGSCSLMLIAGHVLRHHRHSMSMCMLAQLGWCPPLPACVCVCVCMTCVRACACMVQCTMRTYSCVHMCVYA